MFNWAGARLLAGAFAKARYRLLGGLGFRRLYKACLAYNGCLVPLARLHAGMPRDQFMVVDYDDIVRDPALVLPGIFRFAGLDYRPEFAQSIRQDSLKKSDGLTPRERRVIRALCDESYQTAKQWLATE